MIKIMLKNNIYQDFEICLDFEISAQKIFLIFKLVQKLQLPQKPQFASILNKNQFSYFL